MSRIISFNSKSILNILSVFLLMGFFLSGCTVIGNTNTISTQQARPVNTQNQNTPLKSAANELATTPWPQAQKITLPNRMAGMVLGTEKEKTISVDPVEAYIDRLNRRAASPTGNTRQDQTQPLKNQRLALLRKDAAEHLLTADKVTDAVYTSLSSNPLRALDVNIAETAISDLRDARNIYVKTLKKLADDGEDIQSIEISQLKKQFMNASRKLGRATDDLADRVNNKDSSNLVSNFIRSR